MRLFAALRPPVEVLEHLQAAVDAVLPPWTGAGPPPLRWTDPEQRHVTLAFYGEVPDGAVDELAAELAAAADEAGPLELQLSGAGVFSGTALWIGVRDADRPGAPDATGPHGGLLELMARCETAGEGISMLEPRDRRRAHLTLARLGRRGAPRDGGRRADAFRGRSQWGGPPGGGGRDARGRTDRWAGPGGRATELDDDRGSDWRRGGGRRRQAGPARSGRSRHEPVRPGGVDLDAVVHALSVYRGPVWPATRIELVASRLGEGRGGGAHHEVLADFLLGGRCPPAPAGTRGGAGGSGAGDALAERADREAEDHEC